MFVVDRENVSSVVVYTCVHIRTLILSSTTDGKLKSHAQFKDAYLYRYVHDITDLHNRQETVLTERI